jgi:rhamnogalacturonyl hydrolase YesR
LKQIADAAKKYQSKNGGFHVMVDDQTTPEEVTGMAMVVASVKEAVRKGWIKNYYDDLCNKGWDFIQKSVDSEGNVRNVYNGWAVPAEERKMDLMDKGYRAFINGIIIIAVDEITR